MKVAVIGSGISGLGAAYALKDSADVTVFEAEDRAGGHSRTISFTHDGRDINVDIGFIVYNPLNYPNLCGLFDALGVVTQSSDMSFGIEAPDGFTWSSDPAGLFARRRNLLRPRFVRFLLEILKFNKTARAAIANDDIGSVSFSQWLDSHGFSADLRDNYILPMGAAIWSTPEARMMDYPAASFIRFFDNHRLLHAERPRWRTVTRGSQQYVARLMEVLGERVRLSTPVQKVSRGPDSGVVLRRADGRTEWFNHVILAGHSDQSLAALSDEFEEQRFLLGSARYQSNDVVLHTDASLMPKRRAAWASWNVIKTQGGRLCLTYWMNRLQGIDKDIPVFVTLNPEREPASSTVIHRTSFDHPVFDGAAEAAVRQIKRINGQGGVWLAGAWMGHGFHEDGLKSGLSCALSLGGQVPWTPENVEISSLGSIPLSASGTSAGGIRAGASS